MKLKDIAPTDQGNAKRPPAARASAKVPRKTAEHGTSLLTAFQEIRELIVHGRMAPGTWIVEADLAARLNMSRTPVRTAIHWLQREGYVLEHRGLRKSRTIVAPLTKEDANELYQIIGRLEAIAGANAAHLPQPTRDKLLIRLLPLNDQLRAIADRKGISRQRSKPSCLRLRSLPGSTGRWKAISSKTSPIPSFLTSPAQSSWISPPMTITSTGNI